MSSFAIAFITKRNLLFALLAGSLLLTACSRQAHSKNGRYQLEGVVVSVNKPEHSLVVKHERIPGFMLAMTMPYDVADAKDLLNIFPGSHIRADVVVDQEGIRLERIRVVGKTVEEQGTL